MNPIKNIEYRERFTKAIDESLKNIRKQHSENHPLVEEDGRLYFKGVNPRVWLVNEVDDEPLRHFTYLTGLILSDGVTKPDESFLEACDCNIRSTCCRKDNEPCHDTQAYTSRGTLAIPPGTAIYECTSVCRCTTSCRNRVVQRGRQMELEVFKTFNKGWGVRALTTIQPNTFVEEYIGEVIGEEEGQFRGSLYDSISLSYLFDMDFAIRHGLENKYVIDAFHLGNVSRFINHSCAPNLKVHSVFYDSADVYYHRIAFFSNRRIEKGEELTLDYGGGYLGVNDLEGDQEITRNRMECHCKATTCRKWIY
ncbi:hypothetical protein F4703DRAFT_1904463 [Phycomyces blakesleeanus]|uniref:Histone-lysine N-methyltransferase n=2 Tax=Phycomyces blakesleeanus TaxID=4837 RepID=A0A162NEN4_PHYB8|nr:hypothetical protein PHYBLDRAFT_156239 [Phycomyces blakesleeanus NRRL 1555(-)]OAD68844.1 hypothetical protein PHYBLDRAFT_156239 [Phycomyces blakesleeanus NRRL 1555(-)]|eukprot:XP_018286884.1 hypothetical protein PHYBLDRAFT_156239 [Phycomyces blakesleeanus NRRL 1555(-)]